MRKGFLIAAIVACVLGSVVSVVSTVQHFRIEREGLATESFCAINQIINCDLVNASSYSEFLNVPVAWWGLAFYVSIFLMTLFAVISKREKKSTVTFIWMMSLGSIIYSALLGYISLHKLGVVCLECISLYIVNMLLVVFFYFALNVPFTGLPIFMKDYIKAIFGKVSNLSWKPRLVPHLLVVVSVFFVAWVGIKQVEANDAQGKVKVSAEEKVKAFYEQSEFQVEIDSAWRVWGNPNAKVAVIEYSDFQCPVCKVSAFKVRPYLQEFKNDIRYYFVNYPLDQSCNKTMQRQMHPNACISARAGLCVIDNDDFWEYHDFLFKNQNKISASLIEEYAKSKGWDLAQFKSCMESPETEARLQKEMANAEKLHVDGTPTIFVGARKLRFWADPKVVQGVVREEIKRQGKAVK